MCFFITGKLLDGRQCVGVIGLRVWESEDIFEICNLKHSENRLSGDVCNSGDVIQHSAMPFCRGSWLASKAVHFSRRGCQQQQQDWQTSSAAACFSIDRGPTLAADGGKPVPLPADSLPPSLLTESTSLPPPPGRRAPPPPSRRRVASRRAKDAECRHCQPAGRTAPRRTVDTGHWTVGHDTRLAVTHGPGDKRLVDTS